MLFFGIVITVIFSTFGVVIKSLSSDMNSNTDVSILDIINIAYWPIFGYTDNLMCLTKHNCSEMIHTKNLIYAKHFSVILFIMYVIVILVLVNLLIAMFK